MIFSKSLTILSVLGAMALAVPGVALADAAKEPAPVALAAKGDKAFPIDGAKFKAQIEKRIDKRKTRLVGKLDEKKVSADERKAALAAFDAGAKKVRDAATRVAADGKVTQDEAREVREVAKSLRKDAAGKRGKKKGGKKAAV